MARCKNTEMLMKAVKKAGGGKVQTSADTARKLATEMGGMKKGGGVNAQDPITRRPVTPSGRPMTLADLEQSNRDTGGMNAAQVKAAGEAIGRGNRTPREKMPPKPVKRAQGGAGKVRKGMMSPQGAIIHSTKRK